ncbi:MAG: alpha-keto acid decarboxylase family protein [Blastococcus sp.]|nr:alpha-keto acid decarboxylase family protein [Blastococcus sp.]
MGAVLGTLLAAPGRRHLLLVGDGSFQLTAQEVSTMLRHDLKPVILLINNGGYTVERAICGKDGRFNDIANWAYADLPKVLHPGTTARTSVVKTADELQAALAAPHDSMIFIEAVMDKYDAPQPVLAAGHGMADIDYGPRGPQSGPASNSEPDRQVLPGGHQMAEPHTGGARSHLESSDRPSRRDAPAGRRSGRHIHVRHRHAPARSRQLTPEVNRVGRRARAQCEQATEAPGSTGRRRG